MSLKIITTSDGSHSLFNEELNETYHSIHGALQESLHVFITNGLEFYLQQGSTQPISILEIGFGTGLNALLTWQRISELNQIVNYTTLEASPLKDEIWSGLNYGTLLGLEENYCSLHRSTWGVEQSLDTNFNLLKFHAKLQEIQFPSHHFDLVYYDAFAPSKQPEMWECPMLKKISDALKPGGIFVTYCAKGQLKRDLNKLGLKVETRSGPPGKKEMVRATKLDFGFF